MDRHLSQLLPIGTRIHDYTIVSLLGSGGFGITYKAQNNRTNSFVAIKEYFPKSSAVRINTGVVRATSERESSIFEAGLRSFIQEAELIARFDHPNIVRVKQIFPDLLGTAYLVLEYCEGWSLQDWLQQGQHRPSQHDLDHLSLSLLDALDVIHRNAILHRDIAPKNILLKYDGTPVLIDFGSARQLVASLSMRLDAVVTPGFAPVEQYSAADPTQQGPWTDIYGFAATLHCVVTGSAPAESVLRRSVDTYVPLTAREASTFRPEFLSAIDWGLALLPKDRPQTISEWRQALISDGTQPGIGVG